MRFVEIALLRKFSAKGIDDDDMIELVHNLFSTCNNTSYYSCIKIHYLYANSYKLYTYVGILVNSIGLKAFL